MIPSSPPMAVPRVTVVRAPAGLPSGWLNVDTRTGRPWLGAEVFPSEAAAIANARALNREWPPICPNCGAELEREAVS